MLPEPSPTWLSIVIFASWVAGIAKVAFGVGAGVFLTPLLTLVLPPKVAVGLMWPVMFVTDISALHHHWRKWDTRQVLVLLPTCFVGIIVGSLFLAWAPSELVRKAIGIIALLFVALQLARSRRGAGKPTAPMPIWAGWIIGFLGGIVTSLSHSGGIIISIYLLSVGLTKNVFIASLVSIFFVGNLVKFPLYWQTGILTPPILLTGLALTPVMLLGGRAGLLLNRRVTVAQFTKAIVLIVGLSGLVLLANP